MVKAVLAVVVVAALLAGAVVGAVWAEAFLRLGGERLTALSGDVEALGTDGAQAPETATTVLVALVEEHDPLAARPAPLAGEVALVQVAPQRDEAVAVLLPTALEVTVDGEGAQPLAEVHRQGGLDRLVRAVIDYTGVALDHAVAASVDALPALTRALGGVERCDAGGCRLLDADAVRLVTTTDGPVERARAVADVLRGLAAQVGPGTALRSPLRAHRAITALTREVVTDASLRGRRLLEVAEALAAPRELEVALVPGLVNPDSGRFVVRPEAAEVLFQHLRRGSGLEQVADVAPDAVPEDVRVGVLNGTGTAGLAARTRSRLERAGFRVVGTGNAANFDHERTVVTYRADDPDAEVAAVLVADQLGGAELEARDRSPLLERDEVDVLVTAGRDLDDGEEDE